MIFFKGINLKSESKFGLFYHSAQLIIQIFLIILLAALFDYPKATIIIFTIVALLQLPYLYFAKPF
jgi:hypothetical protein